MGILSDYKKDGDKVFVGSGNGDSKYTLGQGVFKGKLLQVIPHKGKKGGDGYSATFKPSKEYAPNEDTEINDVQTYWFFDNKDEFLLAAYKAVNDIEENEEVKTDDVRSALLNDDIMGKCCIVRTRERLKDGTYACNQWGYPNYRCFFAPLKEYEALKAITETMEHLVVNEAVYREMCASKEVPPLEHKIEGGAKMKSKPVNTDNMPF
jgi:hypothetical protein